MAAVSAVSHSEHYSDSGREVWKRFALKMIRGTPIMNVTCGLALFFLPCLSLHIFQFPLLFFN